jgi:2-keto-4-pentenoate hydratase/2-oxohepta-3-ene-1,7-dioic acid hydratase in catechol pathway
MKLLRFGEKGNEKPGVLHKGVRKDCSGEFEDWNREFFQNKGLRELRKMLDSKGGQLPDIPETQRYASCIARPGLIMCIGLNYSDHAKESNMELPAEPIIFGKATNTIAGPFDDVNIPLKGDKTDYEIELGVVLGKDVSYLASEE